ncbi:hypothetical protein CGRA01v4_14780 [Colletotrichum graminicola]|uniref:Uncharacterized protein n=1 Tax=Colletotrichum graminicola (strain M1.001 / M2 / FGSC 10212) TaxID=645133 RepID=E3QF79_COLGM|nr:uncharacterized protein GLRG_04661 [Colletotrichum graminicola M1.001]EFQ29517.1 hypothetical protein GLRG_04661 [Colletotrichum graminicola M1.001]WDK23488.1 hypothetical protein CGRA01v4_14780 [Colletotrichum graminicola]
MLPRARRLGTLTPPSPSASPFALRGQGGLVRDWGGKKLREKRTRRGRRMRRCAELCFASILSRNMVSLKERRKKKTKCCPKTLPNAITALFFYFTLLKTD